MVRAPAAIMATCHMKLFSVIFFPFENKTTYTVPLRHAGVQ